MSGGLEWCPRGTTQGNDASPPTFCNPSQGSVNHGISSDFCSMEYTSVDTVMAAAMALGRGTLLAKNEIKSAYRIIPVCVGNWPLLGITWCGRFYVDARLPYGLQSAPKIFNAVADALEWCFRHEGVLFVDNYLDDFIILGPLGKGTCAQSLCIIRKIAAMLGIPLAEEKCEGPCTVLTFLGIRLTQFK